MAAKMEPCTRKNNQRAINDDADMGRDVGKHVFRETPRANPQKNDEKGLLGKSDFFMHPIQAS